MSDAAGTGAEVPIDPVELRQDVETQPLKKSVISIVRQSTDVYTGCGFWSLAGHDEGFWDVNVQQFQQEFEKKMYILLLQQVCFGC